MAEPTSPEPAPTPQALVPAATAFEDAHQLWHDAANAYHEPEEFRRRAEALIQATRNVTFRIQSEKHNFPRFDEWYPRWQDYMKSDERLLWLNDARVDVVKRGGLRAGSFAIVRVIDSYLEPRKQLLRLPASTATADLVRQAQHQIPAEYRQHIAIEVSRRWVAEGRSEELLWLISYCLHVLDALLLYSREVIEEGLPVEPPKEFIDLVQYPPCVAFDPSWIPLMFEADTCDEFHFGFVPKTLDADVAKAGAKRYKLWGGSLDATDPMERADQLHEMARTIFKRDGYYASLFEFRGPGANDVAAFTTIPEDKRHKFLTSHALGQLVRRRGYTSVITTSEVWFAPFFTDVQPYQELEQVPDRQEALTTWVDTQRGDAKQIISRIFRVLRKPYLRSAQVEPGRMEDGFLSPVQRAWAARPVSTGVRSSGVDHGTRTE